MNDLSIENLLFWYHKLSSSWLCFEIIRRQGNLNCLRKKNILSRGVWTLRSGKYIICKHYDEFAVVYTAVLINSRTEKYNFERLFYLKREDYTVDYTAVFITSRIEKCNFKSYYAHKEKWFSCWDYPFLSETVSRLWWCHQ